MIKKKCGSISDGWYEFAVGDSIVNILLFILFLILLPFVFVYVRFNNIVYNIKKR